MAVDVYLTDTSVLARWFLKQVGGEQALEFRDRFLAEEISLQTVECARVELPHVLRNQGLLKQRMTTDEYLAALRIVDDLEIHVEPSTVDDVEAAAALAVRHNLRFFDAVFLHRATVLGVPLLTADQPLARVAAQAGVEVELIGEP